MLDYAEYYSMIERPFFAPPEWVFGLAWGIIYPLIAIAFIYLLFLAIQQRAPWWLLVLFAANIVGNVLFTPLQLGYPSWPWATLDIIFILVTLVALVWYVFRFSRMVAALLAPYLLWGAFATVLQITIYVMNFA